MFEAALEALGMLASPERMLWIAIGVLVGSSIAFLPGLGGAVALALTLPFIFGMDPINGVALLIGLYAVSNTADVFPSILLGVPGSASSQATIMDGYPLSQQGQAVTALSAAFWASMFGGIIGAMTLFASLYVAVPLVLSLASPELFMLCLLGLGMVGILSKGAPIAGLMAVFVGLLLGVIGSAPRATEYRYTFDVVYLLNGLPLAVIALGLFAVPEIIDLLAEGRSISKSASLKGSRRDGLRAVLGNMFLVVRSAVFGKLLAVIPGISSGVIDWITYGAARQTCKKPRNFGKGDIRGVIAPESANNATASGNLLPALLFGIPGSGSMALILGGFLILGVGVGPEMVGVNLNITMVIIWTVVIANVMATTLALAVTVPAARLTTVDPKKLMPILMVVLVFAAFQSSRHWGDIVLLVVIGAIGWVMKQTRVPRPPLLIGFVLAVPAERYLGITVARYEWEWLLRPGVLIIGILTLVIVILGAWRGDKPVAVAPNDAATSTGTAP